MARILYAAAAAVLIVIIYRLLKGFKIKLYLMNSDSIIEDQCLIPVTEFRYKNNIDISLSGDDGRSNTYRIHYNPFTYFSISLLNRRIDSHLGDKEMAEGSKSKIRDGKILKVGNRIYTFVVTTKKHYHKNFLQNQSDSIFRDN